MIGRVARTGSAALLAALAALAGRAAGVPLCIAGWSFGADVSLSLTDERIDGWAAIAPPLRVLPVDELTAAAGSDPRPKLLIVPEHDEIRQPDSAREATAGWVNTTVEVVPGADHFLVGRTDLVAERATTWLTAR